MLSSSPELSVVSSMTSFSRASRRKRVAQVDPNNRRWLCSTSKQDECACNLSQNAEQTVMHKFQTAVCIHRQTRKHQMHRRAGNVPSVALFNFFHVCAVLFRFRMKRASSSSIVRSTTAETGGGEVSTIEDGPVEEAAAAATGRRRGFGLGLGRVDIAVTG